MENIKTVNDLRGTVWQIAPDASIENYPNSNYILKTSDLRSNPSYIKLIRENWQGERYELDIAPYIQETPNRLEDNLINLDWYDSGVAIANNWYHIGVIQDSTLYFSPILPEDYLIDGGNFLTWLKRNGTLIDTVKPTFSGLLQNITDALRETEETTELIKHLNIPSKIRKLGAVKINGNVETYECFEPITAGDFIEIINNVNKKLMNDDRRGYKNSCVLLEPNKVFIAHAYEDLYYLYGTIIEINGTTITATSTQLNNEYHSCYRGPSAILIEPNKVFIAHSYNSSNYYLYGTIVEINGTEMAATTTQLSSVSKSGYYDPSAILLENNKVFIAHSDNSNYLHGTIVEIDGVTMTATTTQLSSYCYGAKCVLLEPNKIFIAHSYADPYRASQLYGTIVEINGIEMTVTSQWPLHGDNYSNYVGCSCVLLEPNKVFIAHTYLYYYLHGTIVEINGTTMRIYTTKLDSFSGSCVETPSCVLLDTNKVFIAHSYSGNYKLYGTIVEINGTEMIPTSKQINNVNNSSYYTLSCCSLDTNKVFIAHSYSDQRRLYGTLYIGDKAVQLNKTINGVAKTGGKVGEEIQVYVPKVV